MSPPNPRPNRLLRLIVEEAQTFVGLVLFDFPAFLRHELKLGMVPTGFNMLALFHSIFTLSVAHRRAQIKTDLSHIGYVHSLELQLFGCKQTPMLVRMI
jgi:hypothetical protein